MGSLSYFSAAVLKHCDQGNIQKEEFITAPVLEGLESTVHYGREAWWQEVAQGGTESKGLTSSSRQKQQRTTGNPARLKNSLSLPPVKCFLQGYPF